MNHYLEGKKILITGASSGIGHATAIKLLERGAIVYGASRRPECMPSGVHPRVVDLEKEESILNLFAQLPAFDIMINNAGLAILSSITEGHASDWQRMWNINVHALTLCCQLALEKLDPVSGQILNVSSMSGHRVPPSGGFYAATKFAVNAVTQALRAELRAAGRSVRVSSISPGFVDTPLLNKYFAGREDQLAATKKSMTMLKSEDIAGMIVNALNTPEHVEVGDILLRSVDQSI